MPFKQIGPMEIILILVIIFVFFGVGKLPQVGEAMGKAIRSFKKSASGDEESSAQPAVKDEPPAPTPDQGKRTAAKKA